MRAAPRSLALVRRARSRAVHRRRRRRRRRASIPTIRSRASRSRRTPRRRQPYDIGRCTSWSYNLFVNAELQADAACARRTSTPSTRCPTRAGSPTASAPGRSRPTSSRAAPIVGAPPDPSKWVLIREKTAGAHPGFTARDAKGETWFLEFDPPEFAGGRDRGRGDRDQDLLGARLQPGRDRS